MKKLTLLLIMASSILASAQDWQPTYSDALSASQKETKPIVLVFAGSDWCVPCIKLERSIWRSKEFIAYSKEHYILYKADFPRKKSNQLPTEIANQNSKLAETFNTKGHFPLVVVLDTKEKVLGNTGFKNISPNEYISLINSFVK